MEKSHGVLTSDPTANPQIGDTLKFNAIQFSPYLGEKELSIMSLSNWEVYEGTLLSISFANSKTHKILGSGVLIGPGIALCAKHVIEEHYDMLINGKLEAQCMGFTSQGLQIWRVKKINPIENSDMVILGLIFASNPHCS